MLLVLKAIPGPLWGCANSRMFHVKCKLVWGHGRRWERREI